MNTFMDNLRDKLENSVGRIANTLSNQRHMAALRSGMVFTLPFTLLGGIVMIMMFPPVTATLEPTNPIFEFLIAWKNWGATTPLLQAPYYLTMGILSVYTVFGISFNLAKSHKINQGYASLIALCTFLCIATTPTRGEDKVWSIALTYLDAQGMFLGIIVAMITVEITAWMIKKKVGIKLPDSVPPNITAVFEYLFPLAVNVILFITLNEFCKAGMGVWFSIFDTKFNLSITIFHRFFTFRYHHQYICNWFLVLWYSWCSACCFHYWTYSSN